MDAFTQRYSWLHFEKRHYFCSGLIRLACRRNVCKVQSGASFLSYQSLDKCVVWNWLVFTDLELNDTNTRLWSKYQGYARNESSNIEHLNPWKFTWWFRRPGSHPWLEQYWLRGIDGNLKWWRIAVINSWTSSNCLLRLPDSCSGFHVRKGQLDRSIEPFEPSWIMQNVFCEWTVTPAWSSQEHGNYCNLWKPDLIADMYLCHVHLLATVAILSSVVLSSCPASILPKGHCLTTTYEEQWEVVSCAIEPGLSYSFPRCTYIVFGSPWRLADVVFLAHQSCTSDSWTTVDYNKIMLQVEGQRVGLRQGQHQIQCCIRLATCLPTMCQALCQFRMH